MSRNTRAPRTFPGRAFTFGRFGLVSVMLASVASCAQARTETARDTTQADTVQLTITTDKEQYATGETIQITITVVNGTDQPVTLQFTSGQRYDLSILTENREVWRWGQTRGFVQMLGSETLEPGGQKMYTEQYAGDLSAGTYTLTGVITSRNYPLEARTSFTVR